MKIFIFILTLIQIAEYIPRTTKQPPVKSHIIRRSCGSLEILKIIYKVPTIPIIGKMTPPGTLKFLGAFGRRFLKTNKSTCASTYEIIQNTEPARIRKEIMSAELSLRYPNTSIETLTNTCPNHGTLCLLVLVKILGSIFIFAIP